MCCWESGFGTITSEISTRCWQVPILLYLSQLKPIARSTFYNSQNVYTYMYLRRFITYNYLQLCLNHQDTILRNRFNCLQEHFLYNHSNISIKHINSGLDTLSWQVHWNTFAFALFYSLLL